MTLVEFSMEGNVMGVLADTTAPNFGQWRGAITILQVEIFIIVKYSSSKKLFRRCSITLCWLSLVAIMCKNSYPSTLRGY